MTKILVNGALGRMGSEVIRTVVATPDMEIAGGVDINGAGKIVALEDGTNLEIYADLEKALEETKPDVVVDFTVPAVVMGSLRVILNKGIKAVVGTTGFTDENLAELGNICDSNNTACLIVPNFSLGAIMMIKFACEAAKYFPNVEIIELHHDKKLDAPSGTAILTAQKIAAVRKEMKQGHPEEKETMPGARGADYEGMKIHSVRLPGYVASQEVIFGNQGETLKISTDPVSRECYMPGVMLACRQIITRQGVIYGLDQVLD